MTPFAFGRTIAIKMAKQQKCAVSYDTTGRRMSTNVEIAPEMPDFAASKSNFSQFVGAQADAREQQRLRMLRAHTPDYSPQHLKPYGPNADRMALDAAWREEHRFAPETPGSPIEVETFNGTGKAIQKETAPLVNRYYQQPGTTTTAVDNADLQRQLAALQKQPNPSSATPPAAPLTAPKLPAPMSAPKPLQPAQTSSVPKAPAPKTPAPQSKSTL
jgi:hypothetical protein